MPKDVLANNGALVSRSPLPGPAIVVANQIYLPETMIPGTGTGALTANRLFFAPFLLPGLTINRIQCEVTTLLAGSARMGLYNNLDGRPGTLIVEATGVADLGTVGVKELPFADYTVTDWVWGAIAVSSAATFRTGAVGRAPFGIPNINMTGLSHRCLYRGFAFAALPADESAQVLSFTGGPMIGVRKA